MLLYSIPNIMKNFIVRTVGVLALNVSTAHTADPWTHKVKDLALKE